MAKKITPGTERIEGPLVKDTRTINHVLDLVNARNFGQLTKQNGPPPKPPLPTDCVMVKNTTGDVRERGDAIQLSTSLLDPSDAYRNPWFECITPTGDLLRCGILDLSVEENGFVPAHMQGACAAKVNVLDTNHDYAEFVSGSNVLHSAETGPLELLSSPDGTGEQIMEVRFLASPERHVIAIIPPVAPEDELVLQMDIGQDGWYDARVADPVDLSATDEEIWLRFLNERPPYIPADWKGIARPFGEVTIEAEQRPAYLIEILPICRNRVTAHYNGAFGVDSPGGQLANLMVNTDELVGFTYDGDLSSYICQDTGFYWLHFEGVIYHNALSGYTHPTGAVKWTVNGTMVAQAQFTAFFSSLDQYDELGNVVEEHSVAYYQTTLRWGVLLQEGDEVSLVLERDNDSYVESSRLMIEHHSLW